MRKRYFSVAATMIIASGLLLSSCLGSFTMTKKLISWNNQVGNKIVNELVFFAFWILPVYEVSALADIIVLNSIEFWSGTNPLARGTKMIDGHDGRYLVECDGKGYTIKSENDGSVVRLDFNCEDRIWSVELPDGTDLPLMTMVDTNHVLLPDSSGGVVEIELSEKGVRDYSIIASGVLFASK